jgi:hypothetical protein
MYDEAQIIFISETTGPIGTKLCLVLWWPPFKIASGNPDIQPTWPLLVKTEKVDEILIVFLLRGRDCRTQFWKGITQGPFHQSLVLIDQVVSEEKIFCVRVPTANQHGHRC